ncbi:MAG: aminotransferase class V-fold PLP-dependent enzyme, partial [Candidatus Micrarchaeia archaeon]
MDYAATTPVRREVIEEMMKYFDEKFGNPSSLHSFGIEAR